MVADTQVSQAGDERTEAPPPTLSLGRDPWKELMLAENHDCGGR
jgi:hypothetical protein